MTNRPRRVRPLQRRRHQLEHQVGKQQASRHRLRVPAQRGPQRAEPLRPATPANPDKPEFRRNQFGFVLGGPIGRTRPSSSRTTRARARASAACGSPPCPPRCSGRASSRKRWPGGADDLRPGDHAAEPGGGTTRDPFPGNTIPAERVDPAAAELLARYPLPNLPGTANNYRRVANEDPDQDQFDVRVDHRASSATSFSRASATLATSPTR